MQQRDSHLLAEKENQRAKLEIPRDALVITLIFPRHHELAASLDSIRQALHRLLPAQSKLVRVLLLDENQMGAQLTAELQQRELEHFCQVIEAAARAERLRLMQVSDIVFYCYILEAISAVVLEGMAAGCAVALWTRAGTTIPELTIGRGVVVPAGDRERMSDCLSLLLSNKSRRENMGYAAQDYATRRSAQQAPGQDAQSTRAQQNSLNEKTLQVASHNQVPQIVDAKQFPEAETLIIQKPGAGQIPDTDTLIMQKPGTSQLPEAETLIMQKPGAGQIPDTETIIIQKSEMDQSPGTRTIAAPLQGANAAEMQTGTRNSVSAPAYTYMQMLDEKRRQELGWSVEEREFDEEDTIELPDKPTIFINGAEATTSLKEGDTASWIASLPTIMLPTIVPGQFDAQMLTGTTGALEHNLLIYDNQATWELPVITRPGTQPLEVSKPEEAPARGKGGYWGLMQKLIKNSGIYAIASLASPLITLGLSPFLTRQLSRTDYGALAILTTVVALAAGVSELGLSSAFVLTYAGEEDETPKFKMQVLSTYTILSLLVLLPVTALGIIAAPELSILVLNSPAYTQVLQIAALLMLSQNLINPGLIWLRVDSKAALYSVLSIANLLVTAGATIILLAWFHMGIAGALIGNGLGNVVVIVIMFPVIFWRSGFQVRFSIIKKLLGFGVPNVVNVVFAWVLQLSDRYLLGRLATLALAAGYSVAYSLGGALSSAIISPFTMAWWVLMYPIAKRDDATQVFKMIFRGFSFILLFATMGLSLLGAKVMDLLFPATYHAQTVIIPVIALSSLFTGILTVVNLGISLKRKTWLASMNYIFSALVNVGINLVFIPMFGAMGAALATLIAYMIQTIISHILSQRLYRVRFEFGRFFLALGLGIVIYFADSYLCQGQADFIVWLIHLGLLLLYGGLLFLLGGGLSLSKKARQFLKKRRTQIQL